MPGERVAHVGAGAVAIVGQRLDQNRGSTWPVALEDDPLDRRSPSLPAPLPRSTARGILSFGIEASRAFWIAVAREGFASGSPPPSRAATVIARASFVNCWPRFASAAAFLCLIDDHFECPDICVSFYGARDGNRFHSHNPARGLAAGIVFVAMLLASLSLWTAIPLSWIYIGSKVSHTQFPSGGPYMVVAVGIIVSVLVVAWLIGATQQPLREDHRHQPLRLDAPAWLKSIRDTSPTAGTTTVVEAVLMGSVLLAALALTVWFFHLAGSPLPRQ